MTAIATVQLLTRGLGIDAAARAAGLHPELVRRFVAIGLVEPIGGTPQAPLLALDAPAQLARAARLRRDLGLGYAGAVLACQLLDRIQELELRFRHDER